MYSCIFVIRRMLHSHTILHMILCYVHHIVMLYMSLYLETCEFYFKDVVKIKDYMFHTVYSYLCYMLYVDMLYLIHCNCIFLGKGLRCISDPNIICSIIQLFMLYGIF